MVGEISTSQKITAKYIQDHYALGNRNFSKQLLTKINLQQAQLQGINLEGSDLRNADLRNADLSCANLSNCHLNNANLMNANLTNANLTGAYLSKANCQEAIFRKASLTNSFLTQANLFKADFRGAILNGAYLSGSILQEASYNDYTCLDERLDPIKRGMVKFSLSNAKKITTITELITRFEKIAQITISYVGIRMTVKNFEQSRPDYEWLQQFTIDKRGKVSYEGSLTSKVSLIKLKYLEKWISSFIKKSSLIIHDLPNVIEQKKLIL